MTFEQELLALAEKHGLEVRLIPKGVSSVRREAALIIEHFPGVKLSKRNQDKILKAYRSKGGKHRVFYYDGDKFKIFGEKSKTHFYCVCEATQKLHAIPKQVVKIAADYYEG